MLTTLSALSLLISCKLSLPTVGLKIYSLPTLALKSHNKVLYGTLGIYQIPVLVSHKTCPLCHQFYLQLGHELLNIMYDNLSLTNSTLLTADMILLCAKKRVPNS
jgi:hypothetical protein